MELRSVILRYWEDKRELRKIIFDMRGRKEEGKDRGGPEKREVAEV